MRSGGSTKLSERTGENSSVCGWKSCNQMLMGISPAATGFNLTPIKLYGTRMEYTRTYRIFELFGLPKIDESGKYYRMGNGMGDAILLYSKMVQTK